MDCRLQRIDEFNVAYQDGLKNVNKRLGTSFSWSGYKTVNQTVTP
jgi:hypothetical protein